MSDALFSFVPASQYCSKVVDGTHDSPKPVAAGKPLITSKHIKGRNIDFGSAYLISLDDFTSINKRSQVYQWDVIISMIGEYCGYCYVERNEYVDYAIKNVGVFRAGSKLNAEWLYYYLNSPIGKSHLRSCRGGSSQPYLSLGALRSLPVLVPASETQKEKIVHVLSALDAKIELNNRINAELEGMAKLLYDYWFVQYDFPLSAAQAAALGKPHLTGHPYRASGGKMHYHETLKREIPVGWEATTLSKFANITMGQSPPGDSYNQESSGMVFFQGSTDFGWRYPQVREFTNAPSRSAMKGDILLSVRAPVGTLNIADQDCCIGRGLAALNAKSGHDSFLFEVMLYFKTIFDRRNTSGTTFGSITKDDLHSLEFVCPPIGSSLLDAFEEKIKPTHKTVLNNHQQTQELTALRDWLLPMLMNGQVTVG